MELAIFFAIMSITIILVIFISLPENDIMIIFCFMFFLFLYSTSIFYIGQEYSYKQAAMGHNPLKMEIHYKYDKDSTLISCDTITVKK